MVGTFLTDSVIEPENSLTMMGGKKERKKEKMQKL